MQRFLILAALGLGLFLSGILPAEAQQWILCSNCTTSPQFQAAALAQAPKRTGEFNYAIGNPYTGVMKYALVVKTMPGEVPLGGTDPQPLNLLRGAVAMDSLGVVAVEDSAVTVPENTRELSVIIQAASGTASAYVSAASAADQQQFGAIVKVSRNSVMVTAPNAYGFDSFRGAQMEVVSPFLYSAMAAGANPAWQAAEIPSLWKGLFNAIKAADGKGPTACIIYRNGDSACYQMHIMDKNAAGHITDSAKDAAGNPIAASGGVGGGGGGSGLNVQPRRPSPGYISWSRGSSSYLICGYIGGKLHSCYIQPN